MAKESPENRNGNSKTKKADGHKKRNFAYSFNIMDLEIRMYIAMGSSMKSERQAYDRYYSSPSYMDKLGSTKVYIIPEKNSTLNGSKKWKDTMREFVENTIPYLEEYHQRSNSESGFATDKKMLGWNVAQKRNDRIYSALFCTGTWHNLLNMGRL